MEKSGTLNSHLLAESTQKLAESDTHLNRIFIKYGKPPLWDRAPGFATLLQIILEQQVSLASAKACFDKLTRHLGPVTPEGIIRLSEAELKAIGFSRQKTSYARHLAAAVLEQTVDLDALPAMSDAEAKSELIRLKGVGEWTSDIYLLMALLRPDIMPRGDVALHTAWQDLSGGTRPSSDEFLTIAEGWRPFRSTAARLLWHYYLSERKR